MCREQKLGYNSNTWRESEVIRFFSPIRFLILYFSNALNLTKFKINLKQLIYIKISLQLGSLGQLGKITKSFMGGFLIRSIKFVITKNSLYKSLQL